MNKNFLDTMHLFACASKGIMPDLDRTYDIHQIYNISQVQCVWNCVFLSVSKLYKAGVIQLDSELYNKWYTEYVLSTGVQYRRQGFVHSIIEKLNNEGIECCVLKGESVSVYYDTPSSRTSSDTDILINPDLKDKCLNILSEMGFKVGIQGYASHHIECTHPVGGLVEIHTKMYGDRTNEICFDKQIVYNEPYSDFRAEDGAVLKTLGAIDNTMYLFMHVVKHFLSSGVGIRQINDFLLYIDANYNDIDWDKFYGTIDKLGFAKFFGCVVDIGKRYLNFDNKLLCVEQTDEALLSEIIADIENGGVFGYADDARNGFYDIYLKERYKKFRSGSYEQYKKNQKLKRLFPGKKYMAVNYPYVNKCSLLMPLAWGHRLICGVLKPQKNEINPQHIKRLEFLKKIDLV